jgi:hypothetical protein
MLIFVGIQMAHAYLNELLRLAYQPTIQKHWTYWTQFLKDYEINITP